MKVIIRMTAKQETLALPILLRHSPGTVLVDRTYIITQEAAKSLREAGVAFTEIGRDGAVAALEGVGAGERV